MAVTAEAFGTQAATVGTEHTLADISGPGTYQLLVDTVNMVLGDLLELRVYVMVLTGGTRRVAYFQPYNGAQPADDVIKISVPVSIDLGDTGAIRCTLKQVAGTGRNFPWRVIKFS